MVEYERGITMDTIRKSIVRDDHDQPVAVQIDYKDWLKIETILAREQPQAEPGGDVNAYRGCLKLTEDALSYQLRVRSEWD